MADLCVAQAPEPIRRQTDEKAAPVVGVVGALEEPELGETSTEREIPLGLKLRRSPGSPIGTSVYLQEIDSSEIVRTVHGRPSPTISATAGLQLAR